MDDDDHEQGEILEMLSPLQDLHPTVDLNGFLNSQSCGKENLNLVQCLSKYQDRGLGSFPTADVSELLNAAFQYRLYSKLSITGPYGLSKAKIGSWISVELSTRKSLEGQTWVYEGSYQSMDVEIKRVKNFERGKYEVKNFQKFSHHHPSISGFYGMEHLKYVSDAEKKDFQGVFLLLQSGTRLRFKDIKMVKKPSDSKLQLPDFTIIGNFRDILSAVHYLHRMNYVHGDISPSAVIIVKDPATDELKYKLTNLHRCAHIEKVHEIQNMYKGNLPFWPSPEMLNSIENRIHHLNPTVGALTKETDVFALGLLLFYMLSGGMKIPFNDAKEAKNDNDFNVRNDLIRKSGFGALKLDLSKLDHLGEVQEVLEQILYSREKQRPTTAILLEDPLFWKPGMWLKFVCFISDEVPRFPLSEIARGAARSILNLEGKDWTNHIGEEFVRHMQETREKHMRGQSESQEENEEMQIDAGNQQGVYARRLQDEVNQQDKDARRFKYDGTSVVDLIRFIRNTSHHPQPFRDLRVGENMELYFRLKFPFLVRDLYFAMEDMPNYRRKARWFMEYRSLMKYV